MYRYVVLAVGEYKGQFGKVLSYDHQNEIYNMTIVNHRGDVRVVQQNKIQIEMKRNNFRVIPVDDNINNVINLLEIIEKMNPEEKKDILDLRMSGSGHTKSKTTSSNPANSFQNSEIVITKKNKDKKLIKKLQR